MVRSDNDNTDLGRGEERAARGPLGVDGILVWAAIIILGPLISWAIVAGTWHLGHMGVQWTSTQLSKAAQHPTISRYLH